MRFWPGIVVRPAGFEPATPALGGRTHSGKSLRIGGLSVGVEYRRFTLPCALYIRSGRTRGVLAAMARVQAATDELARAEAELASAVQDV